MPAETLVAYAVALVAGLCLGSFLNVIIYRLPLQLESVWRRDSRDFLGLEPEQEARKVPNVVFPPSHCPKCHQSLKPWHNIPVISYVFLRGRCAHCAAPISLQYPLVEIAAGLATLYLFARFGLTGAGMMALLFSLILIALTGIDFNHQLLPDVLTFSLLWLGLLANSQGMFTDLHSAVIGAAAGYMVLWLVYWTFKLITGKEGMGYGDFKLLAALGAWLGWQQLPLVIILSSFVGACIGIAGMAIMGRDKQVPIAFGPYLAAAGWIALVWGNDIVNAYLGYMSL